MGRTSSPMAARRSPARGGAVDSLAGWGRFAGSVFRSGGGLDRSAPPDAGGGAACPRRPRWLAPEGSGRNREAVTRDHARRRVCDRAPAVAIRPSVMSHVICRKDRVRFLASPRWQGGWHETVSGGAGSWGARGAGGDHAQGLTSFAEGAQRAGSAQLRRGRVQRAARDRPGDRRGVADQRAQGGPGQEAVCGGRSGSGAWGPAGSSSEIPSQGGRGIRGAPRRAQLRRSARGALAVVAAPAGGPRGGTRLHRHRLARDGAARAKKKMPSNRGGASAG